MCGAVRRGSPGRDEILAIWSVDLHSSPFFVHCVRDTADSLSNRHMIPDRKSKCYTSGNISSILLHTSSSGMSNLPLSRRISVRNFWDSLELYLGNVSHSLLNFLNLALI